jgi:hypothetical protein
VPTRAAALLALAACALPAVAGEPSPCDDVRYARDFRMRYPGEVNKVFDREFEQQTAWMARARAINERVVAVGAATPAQQNETYVSLARSPQVAILEERARKSGDEFRLRNDTLVATPPLALLDPMRPNRAWCMLATQALQALEDKVAAEIESWSTLDAALRAEAARRGVLFAN